MGKGNAREGNRPWTKEEMMAYLDWSDAEEARIEQRVRNDVATNGVFINTRGPGYLWEQVDEDREEQRQLYQ